MSAHEAAKAHRVSSSGTRRLYSVGYPDVIGWVSFENLRFHASVGRDRASAVPLPGSHRDLDAAVACVTAAAS